MTPLSITAARADVLLKRARLQASVAEARHRLAPSTIAAGVTDDLRERVGDGIAAVLERPALTISIATGLFALLARRSIANLFRRSPPVPTLPVPAQGNDS